MAGTSRESGMQGKSVLGLGSGPLVFGEGYISGLSISVDEARLWNEGVWIGIYSDGIGRLMSGDEALVD